jgi:hypothetical protein
MKASAAFETKAWRTDAEGRCYKDRPDKGGEYKTATGKTGTAGTCNQTSLLYSERCLGKPEARQAIQPELSLHGDERLTELIRRAWPRCLTPSCSSIESRSNIKLNETCLPSRKRSTWI